MASGKTRKRMRGNYEAFKGTGWYSMSRGWYDHPIFSDASFCEPMAWEWLISRATYLKSGALRCVAGKEIRLQRGQLCDSVRYMAQAWGWTKSRVERFLKKLRRAAMIETHSETGHNIITICNYDKYQPNQMLSGTTFGTQTGRLQDDTETNNKKEKIDKKDNNIPEWKKKLQAMRGTHEHRWLEGLVCQDGYIYCPDDFVRNYCEAHLKIDIGRVLQSTGVELRGIYVSEPEQ